MCKERRKDNMTLPELIAALNAISGFSEDQEKDHIAADNLLLDYINDPDVRKAFEAIDKWYA